ncbi:MAG: hypothetical protein MUE51_09040 [Thermoleophilia bacterium]|nr:hypothetical protein [Thermoleophilia bacterium]
MSGILLLVIALAAPWTVHLAPPRQRPVALVGVVAVLLLYGIFAGNPLTMWQFWVGLAIGLLAIVVWSSMAGGGRSAGRRPRRRAEDEDVEPTGEL